jgi:chloramphenicol O-acetyltransferase
MPTLIDRSTWPRRHHLAFFEGFHQPHFGLTSTVDATALVGALRDHGSKPFAAMLHAVTWATNGEEALRLRLRWSDENSPAQVVLHDVVHPSFTAAVESPDPSAPGCDLPLFAYATARYSPDFATFARRVAEVSERVRDDPDLVAHAAQDTDELIFVSSVPWMPYTAVSHAMLDPARDSVPRIMWGRFVEEGGRTTVSVSVHVHHGLADGGHVARWFRRLQARLDAPGWLQG